MMTREEAIKALERADNYVGIHYINGVEDPYINPHLKEAIKVALSALRPVSREQVEKVWRGEWEYDHETIIDRFSMVRCSKCGHEAFEKARYVTKGRFCPVCGAAITDKAVQMVMERVEALHGET